MKIEKIEVRKVYNNRLEEAVEVEINERYRGISPSGASTGKSEVKNIPAEKSVKKLKRISQKYIGEQINFSKIDREIKFLKEKIGGNGAIAFSYSVFNASFKIDKNKRYLFPYPLSNVLGGGKHHGKMSIQEILVSPLKTRTFREAFETNRSIYNDLKEYLKKKGWFLGFNDESAIISSLGDIQSLDIVHKIADRYNACIGIDFASNSYYKRGYYYFMKKRIKREKYIDMIIKIIEEYNIRYAEDPLYEEDFSGFSEIKKIVRNKCLIVGDDLTTTNPQRLDTAIKNSSINGIIIKPNQIGTISESIEVKEKAEKNNIICVISHRSGESDDSTISRISIEYGFKLAKIGIAGIRIVKINELLRLWDRIPKRKVKNPWKI